MTASHQWKRLLYFKRHPFTFSSTLVLTVLGLGACNPTSFHGSSAPSTVKQVSPSPAPESEDAQALPTPGPADVQTGKAATTAEPVVPSESGSSIALPTPAPAPAPAPLSPTTQCVPDDVPIEFVTLFDASSSMDGIIEDMLVSVTKTNKQIKNLTLKGSSQPLSKVTSRLIAFTDAEPEPIDLRGNFDSIREDILTYQEASVLENRDFPEYGLGALNLALDNFLDEQGGSQRVLIILMITDTFSHFGGQILKRNYDLSPLAERFSEGGFERLFIYNLTPRVDASPHAVNDSPWQTIPEEWDQIRRLWQAAYPNVGRTPGRYLGFPKDYTKIAPLIVNTLADDLAQTLKVCP